jgi:hypothetical protein
MDIMRRTMKHGARTNHTVKRCYTCASMIYEWSDMPYRRQCILSVGCGATHSAFSHKQHKHPDKQVKGIRKKRELLLTAMLLEVI